MTTDADMMPEGIEANATSVLRQDIEDAEQHALGSEKHAQLEKTEQAVHGALGLYTDWYLLGGAVFLVALIAIGIHRFTKRKG